MPPVLACVACSVSTASQEDFTAHGRQSLFPPGCKMLWMWYLTICEANGAVSRFSVWIQHQTCQSSRSVWTVLSDLCWESWCCPVQVQELEFDDPSGSLPVQNVLWLDGTWIDKSSWRILTSEMGRFKTERNVCGMLDLLDAGNTRSGPDPKDIGEIVLFPSPRLTLYPWWWEDVVSLAVSGWGKVGGYQTFVLVTSQLFWLSKHCDCWWAELWLEIKTWGSSHWWPVKRSHWAGLWKPSL